MIKKILYLPAVGCPGTCRCKPGGGTDSFSNGTGVGLGNEGSVGCPGTKRCSPGGGGGKAEPA